MISNKNRLAAFLFLFFGSLQLQADDFRIVYSSSLSGNLYSCQCGLKLSVGLTKRASYLRQLDINPSKDILVDTGNSLDVNSKVKKAEAIFESFQKLGYQAIGFGQNDISENTVSLIAKNRNTLQSANIFQKGFFSYSYLAKPISYVKRGNHVLGIISLTSPTISYSLSKEMKSKLVLKNLESSVKEIISKDKKSVANWIILLHGTADEAIRLANLNSKFIVIYGGVDSKNPINYKNGILEISGKKIYSTYDLLGDKLGVLDITDNGTELIVKSSKLIEMDVNKLSDSVDILNIMKAHSITPE